MRDKENRNLKRLKAREAEIREQLMARFERVKDDAPPDWTDAQRAELFNGFTVIVLSEIQTALGELTRLCHIMCDRMDT